MHLNWDYLKFRGIRSFIDWAFVDFQDIGNGLHFIQGDNRVNGKAKGPAELESNGAGKSTVWAALGWCLFGKTVGGLNRNDLKPWARIGKGDPEAIISLFRDNKPYTIARNSKGLFINDKTATQDQVDKLVMPAEIFYQAVLLGQGRPLFYDMRPGEKMELFSAILNLDRWDEYSKRASNEAASIVAEQASLETKISAWQDERDRTLSDIDYLADDAARWAKERDKKAKQRGGDLESLTRLLKAKQRELDDAILKKDSTGTELRAIDTDIRKLEGKLAAGERELADFQAHKKAKQELLAVLRNDLADLDKKRTCPTCGQPVTKNDLAKHRRELLDRIAKLVFDIAEKPPKRLQDLSRELTKAVEQQDKARARFQKDFDKAEATYAFLAPMVASTTTQIQELKKAQAEGQDQENPYLAQKRSMEKRLRQLDQDITKASRSIKQLASDAERAKVWVKGFKEIKLLEIDECLAELEMVTNSMLDETGLIDWQVRYAIEKETKSQTVKRGLNVMILSPYNDKEVKWEVWSGGESQRLRICGALALGEVLLNYAGISTDLEILDEPTHAVSPRGILNACDFLAARAARMNKQIFLTDQHALQSPAFTSTLEVIRNEQGRSSIHY